VDHSDGSNSLLGPTTHEWRPDVRRVVHEVLNHVPGVTANTYTDHPQLLFKLFPSVRWDLLSVDFWAEGGRGHALDEHRARSALRYQFNRPGRPLIRHLIFQHRLWTRWGGWSVWAPDDHSGAVQHLHVTYLP